MLPFLLLGGATDSMFCGVGGVSTADYVKQDSIVYINQATNNPVVASFYVIATCGSLFFSKVRTMVLFGAANLAILLIVTAVKVYAFTSLWCAYAAIASVIILVYFWRSSEDRRSSTRRHDEKRCAEAKAANGREQKASTPQSHRRCYRFTS